MQDIIQKFLVVYKENKWYRYSIWAVLGLHVVNFIGDGFNDFEEYLLALIIYAIIGLFIGLALYNKSRPTLLAEAQSVELKYERKQFIKRILVLLLMGFIWAMEVVVIAMGTDSCDYNCFFFPELVTVAMYMFPAVAIVFTIGATFSYVRRDFKSMHKQLKIATWIPWLFIPIIIVYIDHLLQ